MGNDHTGWDLSKERAFMENLLNQRFNFYLLFFSIVVAGALSARTQVMLNLILSIGFIICCLLMATLMRAQQKLDLILERLFESADHPVAVINRMATAGFSVRKTIGYVIPILCCAVLAVGVALAFLGVFVPQL
jgi:hypothetical protein